MKSVQSRNALIMLVLFSAFFTLTFYNGYRGLYLSATRLTASSGDPSSIGANLHVAAQNALDEKRVFLVFLLQRDFKDAKVLDGRHRLRWLYKTLELKTYLAVAEMAGKRGPRVAAYVEYIHSAVWALLAVLFSYLFAARLLNWNGQNFGAFSLVGLAFISFLFSTPRMVDVYSVVEMATIAICLYASLRKSLWLLLLGIVIGVANRETGTALGAIYAIMNWTDRRTWFAVLIGPIVLLIINLDLVVQPEFLDPSTFIVSSTFGNVHILNIHKVDFTYAAFSIFKTLLVLTPIFFSIRQAWGDPIGRKVSLVAAMYIFILFFGTFLGNLFAYLLIVPQTLIMMAIAYQESYK